MYIAGRFLLASVFLFLRACDDFYEEFYWSHEAIQFDKPYNFKVVKTKTNRGELYMQPENGDMYYVIVNSTSHVDSPPFNAFSDKYYSDFIVNKAENSATVNLIKLSDTLSVEFTLIKRNDRIILSRAERMN